MKLYNKLTDSYGKVCTQARQPFREGCRFSCRRADKKLRLGTYQITASFYYLPIFMLQPLCLRQDRLSTIIILGLAVMQQCSLAVCTSAIDSKGGFG